MKILIVDDNMDFCETLASLTASFGYETECLQNPSAAIQYIDKNHKNLSAALLDIEFAPADNLTGLNILEHCKRYYPELPVIMISGKGTIETAVRATKLGAVNFIEKNVLNRSKLKDVIHTALERFHLKGDAKEIGMFLRSQGLYGSSDNIIEVGDSIIRYGRTDLNILVTGDTGTGKKLVAQAIHSISARSKSPFVIVDIPNIQRDLFQSELFGHLKGSFSGANETKKGLFHQANKGTLFLDEIGDLPLNLQANLLNPIEEKTIRRVGSTESEEIDLRFVSATDKDLMANIKEGNFREQLYHRLRECEIHIPTLEDRIEDIPEIVEHFVMQHNHQYKEEKILSPTAIEYLQEQKWNGNVRELLSVMRRVLLTLKSNSVEVADIHKAKSIDSGYPASKNEKPFLASTPNSKSQKDFLAEVDKNNIELILEQNKGNVSKSAAHLGISRETLHNKIRKYGIDVQGFRSKKK